MEAQVYQLDGSKSDTISLPEVFSTPYRPDVIRRVFTSLYTSRFQPQGRDPLAGTRTSATSWGVGHGKARMARVKGERHPRSGMAANVAGVVKGRLTHPPKAEKRIRKEVNRKEKWLATASAIAATASKELVAARGHRVSEVPSLPLIVDNNLESISKAKDLRTVFEKLGLLPDVERVLYGRKTNSGKAKRRGRVTRTPIGPLIIVAEDKGVGKAVGAFPGVNCISVGSLGVLELAPGSHPGRLAIWSKSALSSFSKPLIEIGERYAS